MQALILHNSTLHQFEHDEKSVPHQESHLAISEHVSPGCKSDRIQWSEKLPVALSATPAGDLRLMTVSQKDELCHNDSSFALCNVG